MKDYLLGVDNSGTNIKAALFDLHGRQFGAARIPVSSVYCGDGRVELDLEKLYENNCHCIRALIQETGIDPERIACIGFAGQGKGLYAVDSDGRSVRRAITSSDGRADAICARWRLDGTAERLFPRLYQLPMAGQTGPLLCWLKKNAAQDYARICTVFSMKDYLVFRMTGRRIAGRSAQSGTLLVDLNTGEYAQEILEALGIPEMADRLPPLKWDGELCGAVQMQAARDSGLAPGTPVCAGMFDVNASALAMGVVHPGEMFMILGTCGINGYLSEKPVGDRTVSYNSIYPLPGMYLIEEGSNASSGVLEWVLKVLFGDTRDENIYAQVNAMVADAAPDGDIPLFLPTLSGFTHGSTQGSMDSRGAWIGLNPGHDRAQLLRAVYEGVAFIHRIEIEDLLRSREAPQRIRVAGSAVRSGIWMQIFADVLQLPLEIMDDGEIGARGAAIAAALAAGFYPDFPSAVEGMVRPGRMIWPRPELAGLYERRYVQFKKIMDAAAPVWPLLAGKER